MISTYCGLRRTYQMPHAPPRPPTANFPSKVTGRVASNILSGQQTTLCSPHIRMRPSPVAIASARCDLVTGQILLWHMIDCRQAAGALPTRFFTHQTHGKNVHLITNLITQRAGDSPNGLVYQRSARALS